jgi:hypothetical protein
MTVMLLALAFLGDHHKSYYIWSIAQGSQGENHHPAFQHFCQQSKPLAKFSKRVLKLLKCCCFLGIFLYYQKRNFAIEIAPNEKLIQSK